ncbi:uncharacterized protein [Physcomitrium patens]|uniref:uncharacterized protein isoform X4 n=1 Tax=Physcomitrium patens TaxID=3218 RepID=UPI000D15BB32|nr:calponin homology domain-containing protein DDB_G0272472-like isoform X4 [Physcomitrium patens]|eukprot:XP_024389991.1 calponin homology domain-containing protein DDB_G0272472-like isoform X4 [Physcomitrella patens]
MALASCPTGEGDSVSQPDNPHFNRYVQACMNEEDHTSEDQHWKLPVLGMEDPHYGICPEARFQEILEHNCALRDNFEELKGLHLKMTDSNLQLHEACLRLQEEKAVLEKASLEFNETKLEKERMLLNKDDLKLEQEKEKRLLKTERDEFAAKAEDLENLVQTLERKLLTSKVELEKLVQDVVQTRVEKDLAVASKQCVEMAHSRDLMAFRAEDQTSKQLAADLAHKCKHLEIDLEKSMNAVDVAQQEILTITHEKDSIITNLKDSLRRMEEDIYAQKEQQKKIEQGWECERKMLLHTIETREWYVFPCRREDQQKVKSKEDTASRLKEEYELKFSLLQREKEESERLYREEADFCIKEALTDVRYDEEKQRELRRTLEGETADLRAMLVAMEQASNDMETRHAQSMQELTKVQIMIVRTSISLDSWLNYEFELPSATLIHDTLNMNIRALDVYERRLEHLKIELHDISKAREQDQQDHIRNLENAKRIWTTEKIAIILKETKQAQDRQRELADKNHSLKKKLKETNKILMALTTDHNQLMIRTREIETQLALTQPIRLVYASNQSNPFLPRAGKTLERSCSNAAWLTAEMGKLDKRQSQFLSRDQSQGFHGVIHPQRYQDSRPIIPNREYHEHQVEEESNKDGLANLMKADLGHIREEKLLG